MHTSTFGQMVAYEVARDGFLNEHIKLIRRVYGERRNIMLQALEENFPHEVTWTHPMGGLFLWVTLPEGMDSHRLFDAALKENVAFVPGDSFYSGNGFASEGLRHLRLNFSNAPPEQIREGIRRLSVAIKNQLAGLRPEPVAG
ncbi:MAG: aminotransferase class I/II-fold pyridoxal phosphate-dependent enzyme [Terriglobales bacterium]